MSGRSAWFRSESVPSLKEPGRKGLSSDPSERYEWLTSRQVAETSLSISSRNQNSSFSRRMISSDFLRLSTTYCLSDRLGIGSSSREDGIDSRGKGIKSRSVAPGVMSREADSPSCSSTLRQHSVLVH